MNITPLSLDVSEVLAGDEGTYESFDFEFFPEDVAFSEVDVCSSLTGDMRIERIRGGLKISFNLEVTVNFEQKFQQHVQLVNIEREFHEEVAKDAPDDIGSIQNSCISLEEVFEQEIIISLLLSS